LVASRLAFSVGSVVGRRWARLKVVVLVKHAPCAIGGRSFAADLTVDRVGVRARLNEARRDNGGGPEMLAAWSLADLQIDAAEVGLRGAATVVRAVTPTAGGKNRVVVEGDAASTAVRVADSWPSGNSCERRRGSRGACVARGTKRGRWPELLAEIRRRKGQPATAGEPAEV